MSIEARRSAEQPLDDAALDAATAHYALRREEERVSLSAALVFRIGDEWLALPASILDRIAEPPVIHSLPHRRAGAIAGLVNVGGELVVHVSLASLLGLQAGNAAKANDRGRRAIARLVVLTDVRGRLAITVDEVWGVEHYDAAKLRSVPTTLSRAPDAYTVAMFDAGDHTVGLLDASRVMHALSVAIS